MKAPRKSTIDYVYSKVKTEVIRFLEMEIRMNDDSCGDIYSFTEEEMHLYNLFCEDMISAIEDTSVNYDALEEHFKPKHIDPDELPF